jgi:molybdopterin converting factor small subunit
MNIVVRLHGGLRRQTSPHPLNLDVPDVTTAGDVIRILGLRSGEVWLIKLGSQLADVDHPLQPGDELTLIPPIGGGQTILFKEEPK